MHSRLQLARVNYVHKLVGVRYLYTLLPMHEIVGAEKGAYNIHHACIIRSTPYLNV